MLTPRKPQHANKTHDLGNGYLLSRVLCGYHTPRNGNAHNATPRYRWDLRMDGRIVDTDHHCKPLRWAAKRDDYREPVSR